jgi:hypothetical protein
MHTFFVDENSKYELIKYLNSDSNNNLKILELINIGTDYFHSYSFSKTFENKL